MHYTYRNNDLSNLSKYCNTDKSITSHDYTITQHHGGWQEIDLLHSTFFIFLDV